MYSIYDIKQPQQYEHKHQGRITSKRTTGNEEYGNEETLQQSNFFRRFLKAVKVGAKATVSGKLFQISGALCVKKLFKCLIHGLFNEVYTFW